MRTLIGALLALVGYTFVWDGVLMVRGVSGPARPDGPGLLDLILPSRLGKLQAVLAAGAPGSPPGGLTPAQVAVSPPPSAANPGFSPKNLTPNPAALGGQGAGAP